MNSTNIMAEDLTLENNEDGILFVQTHNSTIQNVTIHCNHYGIYFKWSNSNAIICNTISNSGFGFILSISNNNTIFHNNFMGNSYQVDLFESSNSAWDNDYPSGGNFWSDYTGVDDYQGPSQNILGSDGIGDTPYVIDENNIDHYPLMEPWIPIPPVITATVDIDPDTLNLKSNGEWITAYIELSEGYNVNYIERARNIEIIGRSLGHYI